MPDSKPESSVEGGKKQNKRRSVQPSVVAITPVCNMYSNVNRLDEGENEGCAVTIASAPTSVPGDEDSSTPSPQRPRLELNKGNVNRVPTLTIRQRK